MLTKSEEKIISSYINEYLDGLRMDIIGLNGTRIITQTSDSKIVVVDKDFILDKSKDYEILLQNPVEDNFFIPQGLDYYETQVDLEFDRTNGFKIINFDDAGVITCDFLLLDDPSITDNCLNNLVRHMCFDTEYQKSCSEVKVVVDEFFHTPASHEIETLKKRLGPFLGINI
jgi:hypothetical protein